MGESKRIYAARDLGRPAYQTHGLENDFDLGIASIRNALQIRNQYAHWTWWDDSSGQLVLANLEDLARGPKSASDFDGLRIHHVDMPLLQEQQRFFLCIDRLIGWINYEDRSLSGKVPKNLLVKPSVFTPLALNIIP